MSRDSFAWMHIMFTAELSVLDLFLKTVHWGHTSESVRRCRELFLASHFSTLWNESFLRKAVLPRHAESTWLNPSFSLLDFSFSLLVGAASVLLASACVPSSSRRGLGRRSVWESFWHEACARAPGFRSQSVQSQRLNSAATSALGVLWGINCRQWLARSVVLACPCWSLEGLLLATQKSCLRKS